MEKNPLLGSRSNLLTVGEDVEWGSRSFHVPSPTHSHRHHHHQHTNQGRSQGHKGHEHQPLFGSRPNLAVDTGGGIGIGAGIGTRMFSLQALNSARVSAGPYALQRSNSRLNLCFALGVGAGVSEEEDEESDETPFGSSSRVGTLSSLSGSRVSLNPNVSAAAAGASVSASASTCSPSGPHSTSTSSASALGAQSYNLYSSLPTRSASELASSRIGSSSLLSATRTSFLSPGSGPGLGLGLNSSIGGSYYNSNSSLSSLHSKSSMSSYRDRDLSTSRTSISRAPSTASVSRDRDYISSSVRERDYGVSGSSYRTGVGGAAGTSSSSAAADVYSSPVTARYSRYDSVQRYGSSGTTQSASAAAAAASSSPTQKYSSKLDTLEKVDDWRARTERKSGSPDKKQLNAIQKVTLDTYSGKHEVLCCTCAYLLQYHQSHAQEIEFSARVPTCRTSTSSSST